MMFNLADMRYERELTAQSRSLKHEVGEIIYRLNKRGVLISSITVRELFLLLDSKIRNLIQKRIQYDIEVAKKEMEKITREEMEIRLDQALINTYPKIVCPIMSNAAIEELHSHLKDCFDKMLESIKVDAHRDLNIAIIEIESD